MAISAKVEVKLLRYISVDVEAAGPNPGRYSLLSIGACMVHDPRRAFYVELQPVNKEFTQEAYLVHGLSLERLEERGKPPQQAMQAFADWVEKEIREGERPILVAFNAPFDWMFVNDYFHRYLGRNPFGHEALDIKALYMGVAKVGWGDIHKKELHKKYLGGGELTHNALRDAQDQAEMFRAMLAEIESVQGVMTDGKLA